MSKIKYLNMQNLIYASLMSIALGLFTSMTFVALTHIFIIIPALYFIPKTNFKKLNLSAWFLLVMSLAFILSVVVNQDLSEKGYTAIFKTKYYLIGLFSIVPFSYYFSNLDTALRTRRIRSLLLAVLITATTAGLFGMFSTAVEFNFLKWQASDSPRNSGFAGMLLNYAHNLALLQVFLTGMIYYKEEVKEYITSKELYIFWVINFVALYSTYARGALLAFLVAFPFYFFKTNKKLFLQISAMLIITSAAIIPFVSQFSGRPSSSEDRYSQWNAAIAGFKERPVFGLGYMNFERLSVPLKIKYNIPGVHFGGHAHNNYFEVLASTGFVGFIFFMLWQISWFRELYIRDDLFSRLSLPCLIAFVVGGLTQATFTLGANLFLTMTFYALTQFNPKVLKQE